MSNDAVKVEPGLSRAPSSSAELLKWLDRNQSESVLRNPSTILDHEAGLASMLYQSCIHMFEAIWKQFKKDHKKTRVQQARTRENLSCLVLWGDQLDLGCLDACLERSTEIRDCVLEALHDIGQTLIDGMLNGANHCPFYSSFLLLQTPSQSTHITAAQSNDLQITLFSSLTGHEQVSAALNL